MIKKIINNPRGQTSLILILLTAAALIFLAITLNWGRVAQTKALVTVAADEAASLLASDIASYGEMEKQTYLQNKNEISSLNGIIMAIIAVVVAIICLIVTITTAGGGSGIWCVLIAVVSIGAAAASLAMAVMNLVLQISVVQPGITHMWNSLQKNQPIQQQFYEGGISTALEGVVTDQVNVTDYFDLNTNGLYGTNWSTTSAFPNDTISRFAFFYTDRLRMLDNTDSSNNNQEGFFVKQLGELINGETCGQNANDNNVYPGVPLNPACPNTTGLNCISSITNPQDPDCQMKIPNGFQLNDACAVSSDPGSSTYTPFCDPCCQVPIAPDPNYCPPNTSTCTPSNLHPTPFKWVLPAGCPKPNPIPSDCDPSNASANPNASDCVPTNGECTKNNPYGPSYPYIYDPTYQNYVKGTTFLDQFGRDQQLITPAIPPATSLPLTTLTAQGSFANGTYFPNGIYPFFWKMKDYSPQVNTINPASLLDSQVHWCVPSNNNQVGAPPADYIPPSGTTLTVFSDLTQLTDASSSAPTSFQLPYTCKGNNCCVGYLSDNIGGGSLGTSSNAPTITVIGHPAPFVSNVTISPAGPIQAGDTITLIVTATEASPGGISGVIFSTTNTKSGNITTVTATAGAGGTYSVTKTISTTSGGDTFSITATATDTYGVSVTSTSPLTITINPPTST